MNKEFQSSALTNSHASHKFHSKKMSFPVGKCRKEIAMEEKRVKNKNEIIFFHINFHFIDDKR